MRLLSAILLLLVLGFTLPENNSFFPEHLRDTAIARLKETDSMFYYQCNTLKVESQKITQANGSVVELGPANDYITLTEKYALYKNKDEYRLKQYTSSATYYPNKKFAYLKLVEKKYWNFELKKEVVLEKKEVLLLAAYEKKLREVTEYDFTVNIKNSPQVILNGKKLSSQFMVGGGHLLSDFLTSLR